MIKEKPDHKQVPEAMYYIAICHQNLGEKDKAVAAYKAFISKYPNHEKAQSARNNLAKKYGVTDK